MLPVLHHPQFRYVHRPMCGDGGGASPDAGAAQDAPEGGRGRVRRLSSGPELPEQRPKSAGDLCGDHPGRRGLRYSGAVLRPAPRLLRQAEQDPGQSHQHPDLSRHRDLCSHCGLHHCDGGGGAQVCPDLCRAWHGPALDHQGHDRCVQLHDKAVAAADSDDSGRCPWLHRYEAFGEGQGNAR